MVPAGPRRRLTASLRFMVTVDSASIWTILSPGRMSTLEAGLSSITRITVIDPSRIPTSMPRPPKLPLVLARMSS